MKKIKIILIIIFFILLSISIYLINFNPKNHASESNIVNNSEEINFTIINYIQLKRTYIGEVNLSYVNDSIEELAKNFLPNIYENTKECSKEQIKSYYINHKNTINYKTGISEFEDFYILTKLLNKSMNNNAKIINAVIDLENYKNEDGYFKFKIIFNTDNEKQIKFDVLIKIKKQDGSKNVKFIPIIKE